MIKVDLINFPIFWDMFNNDIRGIRGTLSCGIAIELFQELYNMDVDVKPYDVFGVVYMKPEDYTWFVLKYS